MGYDGSLFDPWTSSLRFCRYAERGHVWWVWDCWHNVSSAWIGWGPESAVPQFKTRHLQFVPLEKGFFRKPQEDKDRRSRCIRGRERARLKSGFRRAA